MFEEYPPENVVEGVRDFLLYETGREPHSITYQQRSDRHYLIRVRTDEPIPEEVRVELRKILPDGYSLEMRIR